jgi:geranylgeranyl pyrophosphate synthase
MSDPFSSTCTAVAEAIRRLDCHPSQRALLEASTERLAAACRSNPLSNPLSLAGLIVAGWNREWDRQASEVGAFCLLYIGSLDLFDDVQDDDLDGKPHQDAGAPIAINSALTLLFLALDALRRAIELEPEAPAQAEYLALFNRVSLAAATGQHVDLLGEAGSLSPDDVLAMQQAKTSSVALVAECGALLARCGEENRARYRVVGESLAQLVQIVDDLRDIFGKEVSPDLATNRITYPIACFRERANLAELKRFDALVTELPGSLPQIRELLYEAGVVEDCAVTLERLRRDIHHAIVETGNTSGHHRLLLSVVDGLVSAIYEPDPIAESAPLWQPRGGWHDLVRAERDRFVARMRPLGLPDPPRFEPWHLPQYLYEPDKNVIYYPDLEELGEQILPFQAELLGTDDLEELREIISAQLPVVLAHEMFHFWRNATGRLTYDSWHEEYAANRLAVGYAQRFCPRTLQSALELARRVRERFPQLLDAHADATLERCASYRTDGGYGMEMLQTAVVHLEMVTRLAAEAPDFQQDLQNLVAREARSPLALPRQDEFPLSSRSLDAEHQEVP